MRMLLTVIAVMCLGGLLGCEVGPPEEFESEESALKKWTPPGSTDANAYGCPMGAGSSCGFASPSLATFCGDVGPEAAWRLSSSSLRVGFKTCPHSDDVGCTAGIFRSPATDGAIAEVNIKYGSAVTGTYRIKPWQLTTSGCSSGQLCVYLSTVGRTYDYVAATPISGASRTGSGSSSGNTVVLFGAKATAFSQP